MKNKAIAFISGAAVMGLEMLASRLLAPFFGTSLLIWANLIAVVLIALTLGYYWGGKLADKKPSQERLFFLVFLAGVSTALIPILSKYLLPYALLGVQRFSLGIFAASLFSTLLLFAIPMTLLGMVSPYVARLETKKMEKLGNTVGGLYALSTAGSVLGVFATAFVLIPAIGTRLSLFLLAALLIVASMLSKKKYGLSLLLLVFASTGTIKPADGLIYEGESLYNYIQVTEKNDVLTLTLNEGLGIQSIYDKHNLFTNSYWDYFSAGPALTPTKNALMIGLAGGTAAKQLKTLYSLNLDAVEIDGKLAEISKDLFKVEGANVYVEDGRAYLEGTNKTYDLIIMDAFNPPYIPFHLLTREFMQLAAEKTSENGIVMMNAPALAGNDQLLQSMCRTVKGEFPHAYAIELYPSTAHVIIAGKKELDFGKLENSPVPGWVAANIETKAKECGDEGLLLTDDLAPVERMTHDMILGYVSHRLG